MSHLHLFDAACNCSACSEERSAQTLHEALEITIDQLPSNVMFDETDQCEDTSMGYRVNDHRKYGEGPAFQSINRHDETSPGDS